ncbi:PAS domain-containing sensor histidine kinase [Haloparvum sedimenti]|uniref:PAS domain-containing sensor histidine kinase n=1 Tax=Haloparvum sedimenti TaxID=1678448 RepID=UPI00071E9560|nr:HAMP domain-containing sensor histidine kinase [Haloparvum sedimenti]
MDSSRVAAGLFCLLGATLSVIPLSSLAELPSRSLLSIGAEMAVPLLMSVVVFGYGVRLLFAEETGRPLHVVLWSTVSAALAVVFIGWVVLVQFVSEGVDPIHVIGYTVVAAAVAGLLIGRYDARSRRRRRDLQRERDRFSALFENVATPIAEVEMADGEVLARAVNPQFEATFGVDAAEAAGDRLGAHVRKPEDAEEVPLDDPLREDESRTYMVRRGAVDGMRDFRVYVVPESSGGTDERRGYCIFTDLTEQRRNRERLSVLNRVLRHDVRTAVNVIHGTAGRIADSVDDAAVRAWVETIRRRARKLASYGDRARYVQSVVEGDGETEPVDVAARVRDLLADLGDEYPHATVRATVPEEAHARALPTVGDAFREVLTNAVEHSDREAPRVEVDVTCCPEAVVVRVADDGPGLPEDERRLLHGEADVSQLTHSDGFGLWVTSWIVTGSGGTVSVSANRPRGTVVEIRLPRVED